MDKAQTFKVLKSGVDEKHDFEEIVQLLDEDEYEALTSLKIILVCWLLSFVYGSQMRMVCSAIPLVYLLYVVVVTLPTINCIKEDYQKI
jgi:hypothetical protein